MTPPRTLDGRRGGYTLVELLVVNILLALLVSLIGGAWRAFGPLCVEVIARGRIVNEANIAAAALYQESNNQPNGLSLAKVETTDEASMLFDYNVGGDVLTDPTATYPYSVRYYLKPPAGTDTSTEFLLVRDDGSTSMTIARHLESAVAHNIQVVDSTGQKSQVEFTLSFAYRGSRSQYTFVVHHQ